MEHTTNTRYMEISYQSLFWGKEQNKVTNTNITNPHLGEILENVINQKLKYYYLKKIQIV